MKLLALETSTHMLSVACIVDDKIIQRSEFCANGGSDRLLPWVGEVLAEAGIALAQLDAIAFGAGPGSFTGLRLSCSIAQGLAYGADLRVVPITTLAALALADGSPRVLSCLDARMNEVYSAAYEVDGDEVSEIVAPSVMAAELLPLPPRGAWKGCGDGFSAYGEALARRLGDRLVTIDVNIPPLAGAVARLATVALSRGHGVDAAHALPIYVREKVALTTQERLARGGAK